MALAFGDARVERRTAFLNDDQVARASALAVPDIDVETRVVTYYSAPLMLFAVGQIESHHIWRSLKSSRLLGVDSNRLSSLAISFSNAWHLSCWISVQCRST